MFKSTDIEKFNPLEVPKLANLIKEIANVDNKLNYYDRVKQTSLKDYITIFKDFINQTEKNSLAKIL